METRLVIVPVTVKDKEGRLVGDLEIHQIEEHRPIETLWDVTAAVTAYARNIPNTDRGIALEREAGNVMQLAV